MISKQIDVCVVKKKMVTAKFRSIVLGTFLKTIEAICISSVSQVYTIGCAVPQTKKKLLSKSIANTVYQLVVNKEFINRCPCV